MPPDRTGARYDPDLLRELAGERSYRNFVTLLDAGKLPDRR